MQARLTEEQIIAVLREAGRPDARVVVTWLSMVVITDPGTGRATYSNMGWVSWIRREANHFEVRPRA